MTPDAAALAELQRLRASAGAFRVLAHAGAAASQERLAGGIADISLDTGNATAAAAADGQPQGYMVDSLGSAVSFAGGPGGRDARIAPLVPAPQVTTPGFEQHLVGQEHCISTAVVLSGAVPGLGLRCSSRLELENLHAPCTPALKCVHQHSAA